MPIENTTSATFNPNQNEDGKTINTDFSNFRKVRKSGDFLEMYQDPTVLGFKLFFYNIADNTTGEADGLRDFSQPASLNNSVGLFGNENNTSSALYYLKQMGDTARYNMLKDFKLLLSRINTEFPWYFQSIDGLNEAWNRDFTKAAFMKEITINCLESVDLRITALMDLYRKIAFDWNNRRAILPDNLRKFDMTIKVFDRRSFLADPGKYSNQNQQTSDVANINREFLGEDYSVTNQVSFNLGHCEFIPDGSGEMFSSISNNSTEFSQQVMKINYEVIDEDNIYRSLVSLGNNSHYYVRDYLKKELDFLNNYDAQYWRGLESSVVPFSDLNRGTYEVPESRAGEKNKVLGNQFGKLPTTPEERRELTQALSDKAKQELGSLVEDIGQNISAEAANVVSNRLNSLFLGNVYGFSPRTTLATGRNDIVTAPGRAVGNALGNIFG